MSPGWPLLVLVSTLASFPAFAVEKVEPLMLPAAPEAAVSQPPLRLAESLSLEPMATLRRASEGAGDQLEAMKARNASGARPMQIGFSRPLPQALTMRLSAASALRFQRQGGGFAAESLAGRRVWGTHVRSVGAWRLRLRLDKVQAPAGTRMWVWGFGEQPRAFGLELLDAEGGLWTPSVGGEDVFLEVELPQGATAASLEVRQISESFRLGAEGAPSLDGPVFEPLGECLKDASCYNSGTFDAIAEARKGVAHLEFISGGDVFICSGGLLNDTVASSSIPYLLTANHCFNTSQEASSLEAFWDYRTSSCNGSSPSLNSLPRSNGSSLLATSSNSDFTFVRLNSIPGGRFLLGWSTQTLTNGTLLHRISHPAPESGIFPQSYSRSTVDTSTGTCGGIPRPRFLYSAPTLGGTFGGSSGSPVMLQGGIVVGQLLGACGLDPEDGCSNDNSDVDGAFATTYTSIKSFIDPAVATTCTPDADTLCIDDVTGDRRFKVEVAYTSAQAGSGSGKTIVLNSLGVTRGGLFWFFDPTNPELLVKILNGCGLNNRYWVFWSAGTDVGLTLTVTDTVRGTSKVYTNPQGTAAKPVQDTAALSCS